MGVAGMQQKQIVLSASADNTIIGFDLSTGRADYKHQIDVWGLTELQHNTS